VHGCFVQQPLRFAQRGCSTHVFTNRPTTATCAGVSVLSMASKVAASPGRVRSSVLHKSAVCHGQRCLQSGLAGWITLNKLIAPVADATMIHRGVPEQRPAHRQARQTGAAPVAEKGVQWRAWAWLAGDAAHTWMGIGCKILGRLCKG
jgi:hypothetical protein